MTVIWKPIVISIEINEKIPVGIIFKVDFDHNFSWKGDHFYGCSLEAAASIIKPFGYMLVGLDLNNAFFVREEFGKTHFEDLGVLDAFQTGLPGSC